MKYEPELILRSKCSKSQKEKLISIINKIVAFSKQARFEGLLALENELENLANRFLRFGLKLIIDGVAPELVFDILSANIYYSHDKGVELLEKLIIRDGVLLIQSGDNHRVVLHKLAMYLGDYGFELIKEESLEIEIKDFLEQIKNKKINSKKTKILDDIFLTMNSFSIQKLFREVEIYTLGYGLCGSSGKAICKVFKNLSEGAQYNVVEILKSSMNLVTEDFIIDAQVKVKDLVEKLKEFGEIA